MSVPTRSAGGGPVAGGALLDTIDRIGVRLLDWQQGS